MVSPVVSPFPPAAGSDLARAAELSVRPAAPLFLSWLSGADLRLLVGVSGQPSRAPSASCAARLPVQESKWLHEDTQKEFSMIFNVTADLL